MSGVLYAPFDIQDVRRILQFERLIGTHMSCLKEFDCQELKPRDLAFKEMGLFTFGTKV
jgi:hypothetical protein